MIKILQEGNYSLIETKKQTKILTLINNDKKTYAWINAGDIGEILVFSHKSHETDAILSMGKYRMYDVKDEPNLTDLIHLELLVGEGAWQGYLLLNGLPTNTKRRNRIIPTEEIITKSAN